MSREEEVLEAIRKREAMDGAIAAFRAHPVLHKHEDSGWRCLVDHADGKQCFKCAICGEWIGH